MQRAFKIGGIGIAELRFDPAYVRNIVVKRRDFDQGVAAKYDYTSEIIAARPSVFFDVLDNIIQHPLSFCSGDALGLIEQVDYRHSVTGAQELHICQGKYEHRKHDRSEQDYQYPAGVT